MKFVEGGVGLFDLKVILSLMRWRLGGGKS